MDIITALTENPGQIASELGATNAQLVELEKQGKVYRMGTRRTGKRGKPPIEWAVGTATAPVPNAKGIVVAPRKATSLPDISDIDRSKLDEFDRSALAYIEDQHSPFDKNGKPKAPREDADLKLLRYSFDRIVATARRKAATRTVVVDDAS